MDPLYVAIFSRKILRLFSSGIGDPNVAQPSAPRPSFSGKAINFHRDAWRRHTIPVVALARGALKTTLVSGNSVGIAIREPRYITLATLNLQAALTMDHLLEGNPFSRASSKAPPA
jgi:hypothetical protein